jgi:hypothetical protein
MLGVERTQGLTQRGRGLKGEEEIMRLADRLPGIEGRILLLLHNMSLIDQKVLALEKAETLRLETEGADTERK